MKLSEMIKQALKKKGFRNLKDAALFLGISQELLRVTVNQGHLPKDQSLEIFADKLGLNRTTLILAAHREKVPVDVKGFFLSPAPEVTWRKKRVWPLSEEQCGYLGRIMSPEEIQLVRKLRQVPRDAQLEIVGYVDYTFAAKRIMASGSPLKGEQAAD
jgi:hypothetical protein